MIDQAQLTMFNQRIANAHRQSAAANYRREIAGEAAIDFKVAYFRAAAELAKEEAAIAHATARQRMYSTRRISPKEAAQIAVTEAARQHMAAYEAATRALEQAEKSRYIAICSIEDLARQAAAAADLAIAAAATIELKKPGEAKPTRRRAAANIRDEEERARCRDIRTEAATKAAAIAARMSDYDLIMYRQATRYNVQTVEMYIAEMKGESLTLYQIATTPGEEAAALATIHTTDLACDELARQAADLQRAAYDANQDNRQRINYAAAALAKEAADLLATMTAAKQAA